MADKTRKFKTEVQQLLHLMVHSVYSNKDIFLRELIANAADAIDKARFESLKKPEMTQEWQIRVEPDKVNDVIRISDNGIGMTEEEVVRDIGTIAKSGTKAFLEALKEQKKEKSPELIGQFGVGFYSAFMVADKVELETKKAGSDAPAVRWSSTGEDGYKIGECARTEPGTTVTVHLKPDEKSYLEDWKVREIVKMYSDFIEHPVVMPVKKKNDDESETVEDEVLNSQKAIWLRPESEITEEEYKQFYQHLAHFDQEPLRHIHYSAEGTSEFKALLYIPSHAPFDLFMPEMRKKNLQLYVRRVFITDSCPNLVPEYMRFLKGVVDSSDLPLNISREMLQDNPQIRKINKNLTRRVLKELENLKDKDHENYLKFYKEFGRLIKEGVHTDYANKDKLQDLLLYETMKGEAGKLISLDEYVKTMPPEQKDIYYIVGENRNVLENSPHLEQLKSRGFDVIFMTDPIDEWVVQGMQQYKEKNLKAVGKGELDLGEEAKKEAEKKIKKAEKEHGDLVKFLKEKLEDKVKEVRFSSRLTDSACCLVADEYDPSAYMEKVMKAMNQAMPETKRILELNPSHPLISGLQNLFGKDAKNPKLGEYAELLYDQALLTEGVQLPDPLQFSKRVADLMVTGIQAETKDSK